MSPNESDNTPDALGLPPAQIGFASARTPHASDYDDVYFSSDDGLAESAHVFIAGNDLDRRWADWPDQRAFVVAETGLGTGRNLLLAWHRFIQVAPPGTRLHLVSIEKHPLRRDDVERIWAAWPAWTDYAKRLCDVWPAPVRGVHRRRLDDRVTVDLIFDDVLAGLACFDGRADAWFLDGFAPARNPRMWQPAVFEAVAAASRPGATFATYSCAGAVRRGLDAAGFDCAKRPGFGRKRDMLVGRRPSADQPSVDPRRVHRPWFTPPCPGPARHIAVVGAGIAGAATAEALARRGCRVQVFDPQGVAGGASGNSQAALYVRPSAAADPRTRFYLSALDYTLAWLARVDPGRLLWSDCGLLQLALNAKEATRQSRCVERLALPTELLQPLDADTAAERAGATLSSAVRGALYYPQAGWVRPDALCQALLENAGASLYQTAVTALEPQAHGWRLETADGALGHADQVVLACGSAASALSDDLGHFEAVRGQVSLFDTRHAMGRQTPRAVVCGRGYVAPPLGDQLAVGASFRPEASHDQPRPQEDRDNLAMLAETLPELGATLAERPSASRVGWRCVSPDRLPCVGPVPDRDAWRRDYAELALDANRVAELPGAMRPGLWVSTAHGAQGMVSAPLAAELLASSICDEPRPLAADLVDAVHPGRRLIRALVRGR
ncbi:bifunctional tRNA (5-methylaminomethyl-2-thiouridine)(34)-methyltransferase MnmD/FAD-dependent 5-carboxymethylaminomethyl-2-thiouridine(34) oxidoreductase MnmC [Salinisphaera sp. SPP-AMP-43]|uniref:bifunctional tRNA (5-methylaminomethyl-2-thiouridine)(34)-methyltransferase MnmD/FAD-dependent 5-carboxymethylaminomethyl-2-thiouridine(34) oxidoreductase MnmC n=1 Tax=Salinisphaera sp. SPP-AMP-43 TaxID=3121288 RepID=UPI003C6DD4C7